MKLKNLLLNLTALAFFAGAPLTHAGSHTWNGAVSGYWNNDANWSAGGAPDPGETNVTIIFPPGATRYVTTNNIAGLELHSLALNGDYMLAGSGGAMLSFIGAGANVSLNGSHVNTIASSLPVVLNSGVLFNLNHVAARLTIDSTISGPQGIAKNGPGVLVFSGLNANTYGNITQVLEGELRLSQANLFPALAVPGRLTIGTDNLAEPALVRLFQNHQIANNDVVVIRPSGTLALNGNIETLGEVRMTGGAITTDNGADTGLLTLGDDLTYFDAAPNQGSIAGHLSLGGVTRTFDIDGGILTISAVIDGGSAVAGITKTGSGYLELQAANIYNGPTTINAGLLQISHALALGEDVGPEAHTTVNWPGHLNLMNNITVSGETLNLNHRGQVYVIGTCGWSGPVVLNGEAYFNVFDGALVTVNGLISGSGQLMKTGLGTLRLEGATHNTFTGGALITGGAVQLAKFANITAIPGPLTIGDGFGGADADQVVLMAHNQIPNDTAITIHDSGLLDLNGFVETLGPITFIGGHLDSGGLGMTLSGDVTAVATNATAIIDGRFYLGGAAFASQSGGVSPGLWIRAQILGDTNHPFVKQGPGDLRLSHTNNLYDGLTLVQQGYLWLSGGTPGTATSGTVVSNGATLSLSHGTRVLNESLALAGHGAGNQLAQMVSFFGTNFWSGPVALSGQGAIRVELASDRLILHSAIGGLGLTKTGIGTLELSGDVPNTYNNSTTVRQGVLVLNKLPGLVAIPGSLTIGDAGTNATVVRLANANQIHDLAAVTVNGPGLLDLASHAETIGSLAGPGNVNLGFAPLAAGGNQTDTIFGGAISGTILAGFTKEGNGRMFLTGTNTYPGKTLVNRGSLFVHGQQASGVNVLPGTSLNGHGKVGPINATNGVVSPGSDGFFGPDMARLNSGNVLLDTASSFVADLAGTDAGTNYCQLDVVGTVNLGGANLSVKLAFASAVSNQFMIVKNDSIDPVVGAFKGLPEGATTNFSGAQFRISYVGGTGNDVVLTQITLPEPPQFGNITQLENGQIQLTGTGIPGLVYILQGNADLKTTNWVTLGEIAAQPPAGALQYIDMDATNHPQRFYRFLLP